MAGGNKLFFRDRSAWGRFFGLHNLRAGDLVTIEKISDYEYRV
jgi:hypothetical protein